MTKLFVLSILTFSAVTAWAHGNKASMTAESITAATQVFLKDGKEVQNYTGVKGWPDGQSIRVKIYLNNGKFIDYVCGEVDEQMVCK